MVSSAQAAVNVQVGGTWRDIQAGAFRDDTSIDGIPYSYAHRAPRWIKHIASYLGGETSHKGIDGAKPVSTSRVGARGSITGIDGFYLWC